MSKTSTEPLLEVEDLTIQYETPDGMLTAVSDATFTIDEAEYFGLVGESGCGKSTIAKAIIGGLDDNGRIASGSISVRGTEIQDMSERELNREIRWTEVSFIPQSAMNSLNPLERIDDQAREIANAHGHDPDEVMDRFRTLFEVMGLDPARISDYPHQFSGGMQQRVIIALSLILEPSLVIADEPTTALDVIMQDQIMQHLEKLKMEEQISMVLITHDISLVFESFDRMAVMHGGQVAEIGTTQQIFHDPVHPYTIMLQEAFPDIRFPNQELAVIDGVPPESYGQVAHCSFAERCPMVEEDCRLNAPSLESVGGDGSVPDEGHQAACINHDTSQGFFEHRATVSESSMEGD